MEKARFWFSAPSPEKNLFPFSGLQRGPITDLFLQGNDNPLNAKRFLHVGLFLKQPLFTALLSNYTRIARRKQQIGREENYFSELLSKEDFLTFQLLSSDT